MEISNKKNCTGCSACYNICPQKAISMQYDEQGMLYPVVNENKCIKCNLCKKSCPVYCDMEKKSTYPLNVYAAWSGDREERMTSNSGGVAAVFSKLVIDKGGIVYGAAFDEELTVKHCRVTKKQELDKLKKSKYVQSYIENSYVKVKKDLEETKLVLFVGTPCQIAGLKGFLGKEYSNLILVDLICHGVPSQKYFEEHIGAITKEKEKPDQIFFRKDNQYCMILKKDGKNIYENKNDTYIWGFLRKGIQRLSCYDCKFWGERRVSDITIGDFWGLGKLNSISDYNVEDGVSSVLINTEKGKKLFENVQQMLIYEERELKELVAGNAPLRKSSKKYPMHERFIKKYKVDGFEKIMKREMKREKILNKMRKVYYILKNIKNRKKN